MFHRRSHASSSWHVPFYITLALTEAISFSMPKMNSVSSSSNDNKANCQHIMAEMLLETTFVTHTFSKKRLKNSVLTSLSVVICGPQQFTSRLDIFVHCNVENSSSQSRNR